MRRIAARELAVRLIFELGFLPSPAGEFLDHRLTAEYFSGRSGEDGLYANPPDEIQDRYIRAIVSGVAEHWPELDGYIEQHAIGWTVGRMSRMTASILRVCIYEILYMPEIPDAAAINSAVDISKKYESDEASSFINGVLGSFWRLETGGKT